jgi:hypothetical protein
MIKIPLISAALLLPLLATASIARIGEGELLLSTSVSLTYDSELQSRNIGVSDTIVSGSISLTYSRPSPNLALSGGIQFTALRYLDFSEFDDENISFNVSVFPGLRMEASRFRYSFDLILNSETRSDDTLGQIVTVQNYGFSGEVAYDPNSRLTVVGNASYRIEDPDSSTLNAIDRTSVGLKALTPLRSETNAVLGVTFEKIESDDAIRNTSDTISYFVGLDGSLLPKVIGTVSVGVQTRSFDDGEDTESPFISSGLSWVIDASTSASLSASYGTDTGLNDLASETFEISADLRRELNRRLSASARVAYLDGSYDNRVGLSRDDEQWTIGAGLDYQIARWGSLTLSGDYRDRSSNSETFSYDRYTISVGLRTSW